MSSSRYTLNPKIARLQAVLAKAERRLPLDQPIRSADLYEHAENAIDQLIATYQGIIDGQVPA